MPIRQTKPSNGVSAEGQPRLARGAFGRQPILSDGF
jgi:hypothetical protein